MSRAFVKENDDMSVGVVAPRAFLPEGEVNYVTPQGMEALRQEQRELVEELEALKQQHQANSRAQQHYLQAKLQLLEQRIGSAKVVNNQATDKVRFGSKVVLYKPEEDCTCEYQLVGVDEADAKLHKISYLSPIAKALMNKEVGDTIHVQTPNGIREMDIEEILA